MEGDAERRRSKRHAEGYAGFENLYRLILRMLPVIVAEIGSGRFRIFRNPEIRGAGASRIFLQRAQLASSRAVESGDCDIGDGHVGSAMVLRNRGNLNRLAIDYK